MQAEAKTEAEEVRKEADEARRDARQARLEAELLRTEIQELRAALGQAGALVREDAPARQARQAFAHCHSSSSLESACSSSTGHATSYATISPAKSVEQSPTPTYPHYPQVPTYPQVVRAPVPKGCTGVSSGLSSEAPLRALVALCAAGEEATGATPFCGTSPSGTSCSSSSPHSILAPAPAPSCILSSSSSSASRLIGWMCMCATCGIMALVCVEPSHMYACFWSAVQVAVDLWSLAASGSQLAHASSCQGKAQARQVGLDEDSQGAGDSLVTPDKGHGGGTGGTW